MNLIFFSQIKKWTKGLNKSTDSASKNETYGQSNLIK